MLATSEYKKNAWRQPFFSLLNNHSTCELQAKVGGRKNSILLKQRWLCCSNNSVWACEIHKWGQTAHEIRPVLNAPYQPFRRAKSSASGWHHEAFTSRLVCESHDFFFAFSCPELFDFPKNIRRMLGNCSVIQHILEQLWKSEQMTSDTNFIKTGKHRDKNRMKNSSVCDFFWTSAF